MADNYDLIEEFKREIAPLMERVNELCVEMGIPMVAAFKVQNREDGESLAVSAMVGEPVKGRTSWRIVEAVEALQATKRPEADLLEALKSVGQVEEANFGELVKQAIMDRVREENGGEPCDCPVCKAERGEAPYPMKGESDAVH